MRGRGNKRMRSSLRATQDSSTLSNVQWRSIFAPTFSLQDVEDLRSFNPDPEPPARDVTGRASRFSVSSVVRPPVVRVHRRPFIARDYYTRSFRGFQVPVGIKFQSMFPVVTCVRRRVRKQVLFALGRTRKGSQGARHRTWRSDVRC